MLSLFFVHLPPITGIEARIAASGVNPAGLGVGRCGGQSGSSAPSQFCSRRCFMICGSLNLQAEGPGHALSI